MWVIDEITGKKIDYYSAMPVLAGIQGGLLVYGYTAERWRCVKLYMDSEVYVAIKDNFPGELVFSKMRGMYLYKRYASQAVLKMETANFGRGGFPYVMDREYEAARHLDSFKGRQEILYPIRSGLDLPYTFGIEFETAAGYVPEDICYRDGLIPLRDGSISGVEYSTVVMKGDEGLSLLRQQLVTLKEYTRTDHDCSLHVHLGGFPLNPAKIFRLYRICRSLEDDLLEYLPAWSYETGRYKSTGKDYCRRLPWFEDFDDMYGSITGRRFFGDLTQPHPNDERKEAKWNVHSRYHFVNFVNLLCYPDGKTVEFRFLHPTFSFKKILAWLLVFTAILRYAEEGGESAGSVKEIVEKMYPGNVKLLDALEKLHKIAAYQRSINDREGITNLPLFDDDN